MVHNSSRNHDSVVLDQDELVNAEAELKQLKQRHRIVKNDRKAFIDESSKVLRKQRHYIEKLEQEKEEFTHDVRMVKSVANRQRDSQYLQTMTTCLGACAEADRQIEEENHEVQVLDKKFKTLREERLGKLRLQTAWDTVEERHVTSMRRIRRMESKREKRVVAFNQALSRNKELRGRMAQLSMELGPFNKTHKKLLKEQGALKLKMNKVIELSTTAYDSREECLNRIATIRDRNEKDEQEYNIHVKDLKRVLAHEQRLRDFMNLKTKDRSELTRIAAEASKEKLAKSSKTCLHQLEIQSYEAVFERLQTYYGEAVLDYLVHNFIEKEGIAFALFNYNSELECDNETLAHRNRTLKRDIEEFKKEGMELEGERAKLMKTLEAQSQEMTLSADTTGARLKSCRKELDMVMRRIVAFVRRLGCNETMVTNRLGSRGTINEANAMIYLGLAEFVCDDFLLIEAFLQHRKTVKKTNSNRKVAAMGQQPSLIAAKIRPKLPADITIVPPSIDSRGGDVPEEFDIVASASESSEDSEPLSADDLRSKVVKTIEKREKLAKAMFNSATGPGNDWTWHATANDTGSVTVVPAESGRPGTSGDDPHASPHHDSEHSMMHDDLHTDSERSSASSEHK